MTQIFLHVGPHKTGTSTIQNWLSANREVLRAEGALYPGRSLNHNNIANQLRTGRPGLFGAIVDEIRSAPPGTRVILSAEAFSRIYGEDRQRILRELVAWPVTIIYYLRRAWERAASAHTQGLKNLYRFGPVMAKVEHRVKQGDYHNLQTWTGHHNCRLQVRVFDKSEWPNGNLIEDFLAVVGLPGLDSGTPYVMVPNRNEMPSLPALRVYASADASQVEPLDHRAKVNVRWHLETITSQLGWTQPRAVLVGSEDIRRYEAQLAPEHERIAREFLGREDGVLFPPLAADADFCADSLTAESLDAAERLRFVHAAINHALSLWQQAGVPPLPPMLRDQGYSPQRMALAAVLGLSSAATEGDDPQRSITVGLIDRIESDLGWAPAGHVPSVTLNSAEAEAALDPLQMLRAGLQAVIVTLTEVARAEQAAEAARSTAVAVAPAARPTPEEREAKRAERRELRRALRRAERRQSAVAVTAPPLSLRARAALVQVRRVLRSAVSRLLQSLRG